MLDRIYLWMHNWVHGRYGFMVIWDMVERCLNEP